MGGKPLQVLNSDQQQAEEEYARNREEHGEWCADCHDFHDCSHIEADCPYRLEHLFYGAVDVFRKKRIFKITFHHYLV